MFEQQLAALDAGDTLAFLRDQRAAADAAETTGLSPVAVDRVDRRVAPVAPKIGHGRLRRLIDAVVMECDPRAADARREQAREDRQVTITDPDPAGIATVWAQLDAPAAAALDRALTAGAAALAALGDDTPQPVRRATTLGLLADPQAALDLLAGHAPARKTDLVLHVHLDETALVGDHGTTRVEGLSALSLQTLRDWCADPDTQITLTPVIDTHTELTTASYQPTPAQRDQVLLRDPVCVFPWCDKPSRNHDLDHIDEYDDTGPPDQTTSSRLARLCRFHHRVKTHGHWRYERLPDGTYLWTGPHHQRWIVDTHGTTMLTAPPSSLLDAVA